MIIFTAMAGSGTGSISGRTVDIYNYLALIFIIHIWSFLKVYKRLVLDIDFTKLLRVVCTYKIQRVSDKFGPPYFYISTYVHNA